MAKQQADIEALRQELGAFYQQVARELADTKQQYENRERELRQQYERELRKSAPTAEQIEKLRQQLSQQEDDYRNRVESLRADYEKKFKAGQDEVQKALNRLKQEKKKLAGERQRLSRESEAEAQRAIRAAEERAAALRGRPLDRFMPGEMEAITDGIGQARQFLAEGMEVAAAAVAACTEQELQLLEIQYESHLERWLCDLHLVQELAQQMQSQLDDMLGRNGMTKEALQKQDFANGHTAQLAQDASCLAERVAATGGESADDMLRCGRIPVGLGLTDLYHEAVDMQQSLASALAETESERNALLARLQLADSISAMLPVYSYRVTAKGCENGDILAPYVVEGALGDSVGIACFIRPVRDRNHAVRNEVQVELCSTNLSPDSHQRMKEEWQQRLARLTHAGRSAALLASGAAQDQTPDTLPETVQAGRDSHQ